MMTLPCIIVGFLRKGLLILAGIVVCIVTVHCPSSAQEAGVCARVKVKLSQDVVISRNAFKATLEIVNSPENVPLTNLRITLVITDDAGNQVKDLFGIHPPDLSGVGDVDGGGTIQPGVTASATWLIVPTRDAAPDEPTTYHVGGEFSFSQDGATVTMPLFPAPILVKPDPLLVLDYFWVRDVYSDDPFTVEKEAAEPFPLGLMIRNNGKGVANNIRITSSQPTIVENEKGLLVDFKIIGTQVNSDTVSPSLTVNLGNLDPGTTSVAKWIMTSSLQGTFSDYKATFEHIDGMGNPRLSLIDAVNIHELVHAVRVDNPDDGKPDFLVNDTPDDGHLPDTLFNSDSVISAVSSVTNAAVGGPVGFGRTQVALTASVPAGWVYVRGPDPGGDNYRLLKVTRSDGREVRVDDNAWTTHRTIRLQGQPPFREHFVHIFDHDSTGIYTLLYGKVAPGQDTVADTKLGADGTEVEITGEQAPVVTALFDGFFYAEQRDRTSGIRVNWDGTVAANDTVAITGIMGTTADLERCIVANSVTDIGDGSVGPFGMTTRAVGGSGFYYNLSTGSGQCATRAYQLVKQPNNVWVRILADVPGLNNVGLLVKTWGTVTSVGERQFRIDDGSRFDDGDPSQPGMLVTVPTLVTLPAIGSVVCVTGISSCYRSSSTVYRLLRVRGESDIEVLF